MLLVYTSVWFDQAVQFMWSRVYNRKSVQLPYGFYTCHLGWGDIGNQQWICLAGT